MKDKNLNILIFNWQDITNPLAGGAEVHLHEVFERIAARGHHVTLFCHRYPGSAEEEVRNGIRIVRRGGRFLFNFHVFLEYLRRFRKEYYDVIIDDVNKIPFYTPLFVHKPIQGITHHLFGKSIFLEAPWPLALYVYLSERLIKPIYKNVHFIIGSPSTYNEYCLWGFPESKIAIINYCVNHSIYYPDPTGEYNRNLIGYFGRLKKYKSVDHLILAFVDLLKVNPDLRLQIIGDGDDRPRLEALVKEKRLTERVNFLGFINEKEKAPTLQKMNLVVNTSSKEGWGLTVVEANACGTPVVAANVQGLRDSVKHGETGLLYEYGNIQDLVEKIRTILDNPVLRQRLREKALEWAKSFNWEDAADKTLEYIYRTIQDYHKRKH